MNRKILVTIIIVVMAVALTSAMLILFNPFQPAQKEWRFFNYLSNRATYQPGVLTVYDSPAFNIYNNWRIKWSYMPGWHDVFSVSVYATLGIDDLPITHANGTGPPGNGILCVNYTGGSYLHVVANVWWQMTIEEYR